MMKKQVASRRWSMKSPLKKKRALVLLKERIEMEKIEKPKVEKSGIEEKRRQKVSEYTAQQKCRAVLSVWTERRKPGEVCREVGGGGVLLERKSKGGSMKGLERRLARLQSKTRLYERSPVKRGELREVGAEKKV